MNSLTSKLVNFVQNNMSASLAKGDDLSISEMADAVKQLPEYRNMVSKISLHVDLSKRCMNLFSADRIMEMTALG